MRKTQGRNADRQKESDYVWARQQRVREWHARLCTDTTPKSPISGLWLSVLPDGNIRTLSVGVEPVQVPALLLALESVQADLQAFVERTTAQVIDLSSRTAKKA